MGSTSIRGTGRGLVMWSGIALIVIVGVIHLLETPEYFEAATYLGILFLANFVGALVAAVGIYQGRGWGWVLGILVAGGAFVAYIISRTVGLPGLGEAEFFEPGGIVSLIVEALFVGLALLAVGRGD